MNPRSLDLDKWHTQNLSAERQANREQRSTDTADAPEIEDVESQEAHMNRDETEGKAKQVKGNLKQAAGHLLDDEKLHDEGAADEAEGDVQEAFGKGRRKVGEALNDLGDKLKR